MGAKVEVGISIGCSDRSTCVVGGTDVGAGAGGVAVYDIVEEEIPSGLELTDLEQVVQNFPPLEEGRKTNHKTYTPEQIKRMKRQTLLGEAISTPSTWPDCSSAYGSYLSIACNASPEHL